MSHKKFLILCMTIFIGIASVLAYEQIHHTYKVYDPRTNKAVTAVLGTVPIANSNRYMWAFYTKSGIPICIIQTQNSNMRDNLLGGSCLDAFIVVKYQNGEKVDFDKYKMSWRELSEDTFIKEAESIVQERALEGELEFTGE